MVFRRCHPKLLWPLVKALASFFSFRPHSLATSYTLRTVWLTLGPTLCADGLHVKSSPLSLRVSLQLQSDSQHQDFLAVDALKVGKSSFVDPADTTMTIDIGSSLRLSGLHTDLSRFSFTLGHLRPSSCSLRQHYRAKT